MLVITTISILLLGTACLLSRRFQDQTTLSQPAREILRLGVQIICGDCCGDSARPVKTYLDQFGKCEQCGGRSYVLASAYARERMMGFSRARGETSDAQAQSLGPQVRLHAVRVHKISA